MRKWRRHWLFLLTRFLVIKEDLHWTELDENPEALEAPGHENSMIKAK